MRSACVRAKSPSRCRTSSTPSSTSSAACARRGRGARTARKTARESDAVCRIELDPRWAEALRGLETVSHLLVLYWMDQARRDLVLQSPRHYAEQRGTFALRSPVRPNPIAASVVRLTRDRRHDTVGHRPRLSRQYAARRHQAVFRLDRRGTGRVGGLARKNPRLKPRAAQTQSSPASLVRIEVRTAAAVRRAGSCRNRPRRRTPAAAG